MGTPTQSLDLKTPAAPQETAADFDALVKRYRSRARRLSIDGEKLLGSDMAKGRRLLNEATWYTNRVNEIVATQDIVHTAGRIGTFFSRCFMGVAVALGAGGMYLLDHSVRALS